MPRSLAKNSRRWASKTSALSHKGFASLWHIAIAFFTDLGFRSSVAAQLPQCWTLIPRVGGMGRISLIAVWAMPIQWLHLECAVAAWHVRCRSRSVYIRHANVGRDAEFRKSKQQTTHQHKSSQVSSSQFNPSQVKSSQHKSSPPSSSQVKSTQVKSTQVK